MKKTHVVARACASPSLFQLFIISLDRLFLNSCCIDFHFLLLLFFFSSRIPTIHYMPRCRSSSLFFSLLWNNKTKKEEKDLFPIKIGSEFLVFLFFATLLWATKSCRRLTGLNCVNVVATIQESAGRIGLEAQRMMAFRFHTWITKQKPNGSAIPVTVDTQCHFSPPIS